MMGEVTEGDVLEFDGACAWQDWLESNGVQSRWAWVVISRKGRGQQGVTIEDALDVALCHGWIDGLRRARDGGTFLQRYSPRRRGSPWSARNVERAEALIRAERMQAGGAAEVAAAQADGRWAAAYASQREVETPIDLAAALLGTQHAERPDAGTPGRALAPGVHAGTGPRGRGRLLGR